MTGSDAIDAKLRSHPGIFSNVNFSLEWLIAPITNERFFTEYWERQTMVVNRVQPDYFRTLFSLNEVDRVLTTLDRRYPDVVLKNANASVTSEDYTLSSGALDVAKIYQLFEQGSTISLAFLDTVVPTLTLFCRSLESEFNFPFQTNVYLTPPGAQGAKPHYDTHDVLVLQVAGSKKWTIFGTPFESPLGEQSFDSEVHELGARTLEFELEAGDVAYIPRGVAHEARSTDTVSLHITAGILRYTWVDFLLEAVASASLADPAFRKALPPGFSRSGFDHGEALEKMRQLMQRAVSRENFDTVLNSFTDRFLLACPPMLEGQMAQVAGLECLTVESIAGVRPGSVFRLRSTNESEIVECYGRVIHFPEQAREAVRYALSHAGFAIRSLPGKLDDSGKLTVIRRLIREGLVMADPDRV